jgi:IS5 family transposase
MQSSFAELEYATKKKRSRRDRFHGEIEAVTPWAALIAEIASFYPKGEGPGRLRIGLERMRRMYLARQWFGLSDDHVGRDDANAGFARADISENPASVGWI